MNFDMNFTNQTKTILKKAASDERIINHNNLVFKTGDPNLKDFDFLKRFGILHGLSIDLRQEEITTNKAVKEPNEIIIKLKQLKNFILLEEKDIKNKNTQYIIK